MFVWVWIGHCYIIVWNTRSVPNDIELKYVYTFFITDQRHDAKFDKRLSDLEKQFLTFKQQKHEQDTVGTKSRGKFIFFGSDMSCHFI